MTDQPSLAEIAATLAAAARDVRAHAAAVTPAGLTPPAPGCAPTADLVRAVIAVRRLRAGHFPQAPGDPVFSMLLELYAARFEGRRIAQTRLGIVAGVPHATAIRAVRALLAEGVLTTDSDPDDPHLLIGLSDEAAERMEAYLKVAMSAVPYLV